MKRKKLCLVFIPNYIEYGWIIFEWETRLVIIGIVYFKKIITWQMNTPTAQGRSVPGKSILNLLFWTLYIYLRKTLPYIHCFDVRYLRKILKFALKFWKSPFAIKMFILKNCTCRAPLLIVVRVNKLVIVNEILAGEARGSSLNVRGLNCKW